MVLRLKHAQTGRLCENMMCPPVQLDPRNCAPHYPFPTCSTLSLPESPGGAKTKLLYLSSCCDLGDFRHLEGAVVGSLF